MSSSSIVSEMLCATLEKKDPREVGVGVLASSVGVGISEWPSVEVLSCGRLVLKPHMRFV